ncbi:MAG: uridine diphosphate-N-acetylglucosamine-binding protein YvcK [Actinomycetota bacterium]|nr:uridine diphosphate-N-acetylglucosamine-binding protein YvcK [Actinomycetota bacterium]
MTAGDPCADLPEAPRVVALGGGHGLAASLSALRRITPHVTAVVTVADDGGSSGRLRQELGVLPPGDLRMALAALCGDDEWGRTWQEVVQHRFVSDGDLHGHVVGNLLIVALWEKFGGNPVVGLDWVGRLLGARGRVLPMASVPLDIAATVIGADPSSPGETTTVRGQVAVATTAGRLAALRLLPENPPACPDAVEAVRAADWVVLGPGSWFSSVLPHLLVPELATALMHTPARKLVALNLAPQPGETAGFSPEEHLEVLAAHAPELSLDAVLADPATVADPASLQQEAALFGAELHLHDVAADDGTPRHDPIRLAQAYARVFAARPLAGRAAGDGPYGRRSRP